MSVCLNNQSASCGVIPGKKRDASINDVLPEEIMLRIFSYLDIETLYVCSQVCKFWYKCAFDGSNWKRTNLFNFQRDVKPDVVEKIAQRCRGFLRELKLRGCRNINDEAIRRFTELCRLIEVLDLTECQHLTNETCAFLGSNCAELMQLSLTSCSQINDDGINKLSKCGHLTHLDASWTSIGDKGLRALAEGCPNLQELRVSGCRQVSSRGVGHVAGHCPSLVLLNLSHCGQNITDEALVYLAIGCLKLRVLSVSLCPITDVGLRALAGTLPSSTATELLGNSAVSVAFTNGHHQHRNSHFFLFPPLPGSHSHPASESHSSVVVMEVNGNHSTAPSSPVSPSAPTSLIVFGCKKLKVLEVAQCTEITDSGLAALARNCIFLEKLDLEDCTQVTDATLVQLAGHCASLNTLVLSHCDLITDEGIKRLVGGRCGPESLQRVAMDNCPLLTDRSLELLGTACHSLRQVDLYDCQFITKQGIENLKEKNPNLHIQAFFAPGTPPESAVGRQRRYCRCCILL